MTGIDLLKMAQEGKLNSKTIVKTSHERHYFDDRDEDYYIYQDNMFHRCNENGKLGSKYQDRFLNYKILSKSFKIYKIIEEPDLFEMIDDYKEPKKIEIPKHIPNDVIQNLDVSIYGNEMKCIAHKVNEIINYLQYKEKKEEQED